MFIVIIPEHTNGNEMIQGDKGQDNTHHTLKITCLFMQLSNYIGKTFTYRPRALVNVYIKHQNAGRSISVLIYFDHGMVVGTKWAGVCISETVDLLGFSCTKVTRVYIKE